MNISPQSALANFRDLHRQVKLTPDNHEAIKESLVVLESLLGETQEKREFKITPEIAFENIVALYNRAIISLEEHEMIKNSLMAFAAIIHEHSLKSQQPTEKKEKKAKN